MVRSSWRASLRIRWQWRPRRPSVGRVASGWSGRGLVDRRGEAHHEASTTEAAGGRIAVDRDDAASVVLDDAPHDREPESGTACRATACLVEPGEPVEDALAVGLGHA